MAKRSKRAFGRGTPDWLRHIVEKPEHLPFARRLVVALGLGRDGRGAAMALEVAAHVFEVHATHAQLETPGNWADLARSMAARARLALAHPKLIVKVDLDDDDLAWAALLRLSRPMHDAVEVGACIALSLALLDAMRAKSTLPDKAVPRIASMASACRPETRRRTRDSWVALTKLISLASKPAAVDQTNSQAPTLSAVEQMAEFAAGQSLDDARALASYLHGALTNLRKLPDPGTDELDDDAAGHGDADPVDGTDAGLTPPRREAPTAEPEATVVVCLPPSVRSLPKAASYATMAELFAVPHAWNRLPPLRLKPITTAANLALDGGLLASNQDSALLGVMSLVISHDFDSTLELSFEENGDLYYSREKRCVLAHRRLMLKLGADEPGPTWYVLYTPGSAADAIERLCAGKARVRRLRDLFDAAVLTDLVSQTEAWVKSLSDGAHPAWSARMAHSLGLAYLDRGATPLEAGLQSLNTSLAPASAANYYQPDPVRQHELASRVFKLLGLGDPGPVVYPEPDDLPAAPDDDEVRTEWRHYRKAASTSYGAILTAQDKVSVCRLMNTGMAASRRAFELVTGARPERRSRPTIGDVSISPEWIHQDDKRTPISSERLLPLTPAAREVIRVAWALRKAARDRLLELGMPEGDIPLLLRDPPPASMLFLQLRPLQRRGRQILATAPLDAGVMALVKQLWSGPNNMGRRYWVTQAARSPQWWAEMVLTGHGRGLAHVGTPCLALPVMHLLHGARTLCENVFARLALEPFGDAVPGEYPCVDITLDLRHIDRRRSISSRAGDLPRHHCDDHSLATLVIVEALRKHTGTAGALSPHARALLSLGVVEGLVHSTDIHAAWECLGNMVPDPNRQERTAYLQFTRASGQPICMPLQPPTRLARDEATHWPAIEVAEAELATWLSSAWPGIRWPQKPHATIVALCWLASRWVRLHVAPFLLEAYRPETLAATLDELSLQAVLGAVPTEVMLTEAQLRKVCRHRRPGPTGQTELQWLLKRLGRVSRADTDIGARQRRANLIRRMAPRVFNVFSLSPAAAMVYTWLLIECDLTYDRDGDALAPSTYYEYLSRVRWVLEDHWPRDRSASEFSADDWRELTGHMLQPREGESDENVELRRIAWRRIVTTLTRDRDHPGAAAALADLGGQPVSHAYRPSAASALVPAHALQPVRERVAAFFEDLPFEQLQALAQLALLVEGANRRGEMCATQLGDLAEDGAFVGTIGNGLVQPKTWWSRRITLIPEAAAEVLVALRKYCLKLRVPPKFIFAETDGVVSLKVALERYQQLVELLRVGCGNPAIQGHSCRGSAAMRMLSAKWEALARQYVNGPLELIHAQALVQSLIGAGPAHLAGVLTAIGHASHKSLVKHYLSAWPVWYAMAMRATQAGLPLDASLIRRMPVIAGKKAKKSDKEAAAKQAKDAKRALAARRKFIQETPAGQPKDSWSWVLHRAHWPKWRRERVTPAAPRKTPPVAPLKAVAATPPQPPLRALLLRYMLLRRLKLSVEDALQAAKIGRAASDKAEAMLALLPTLAEVRGQSSEGTSLGPLLAFARNVVDKDDGRALLAAIRAAAPLAASTLREVLNPNPAALPVTAARVLAARDLLPSLLRLDVCIGEKYWADGLADALTHQPRVRLHRSPSWESSRPRVRVMPTLDKGHIDHYRASALTLIAQMALALWQQLPQENPQ